MTWVAMTLGFTSPLARQMASDPSEACPVLFPALGNTSKPEVEFKYFPTGFLIPLSYIIKPTEPKNEMIKIEPTYFIKKMFL